MDRRQRELYAKQQQLLREQRTAGGGRDVGRDELRLAGRKPVCLWARLLRASGPQCLRSVAQVSGAVPELCIGCRAPADQEKLLGAIAEPLGFQGGRPVASVVIFRCCLQVGAVACGRVS